MNCSTHLFFFFLGLAVLGCSPRSDVSSFVDDQARLLTPDEASRIEEFHNQLLRDIDVHLKVVTLRRTEPNIDEKAAALIRELRLGEQTTGARGVLLLVDPGGKQVRLEVGYALEPVFPDSFVGWIEREQMAPFFASGRVGSGIEATVELLVNRAFEKKAVPAGGGRGGPAQTGDLSGGAGARMSAPIGGGPVEKSAGGASSLLFPAQATPDLALDCYLNVLRTGNKDPKLGLYTPETQAFFQKWLVTDAQQATELRMLDQGRSTGRAFMKGDLAVIRFPVKNRNLPPYFFKKSEQGWRLDFAALTDLVRFNHLNQWHMTRFDHPFMFAFEDLRFDQHGFPQE